MDFGGDDITRCFFSLLLRTNFPYKECCINDYLDWRLLQDLKESLCHLNQDDDGYKVESFRVSRPDSHEREYQLHIGDESIVAPLAAFFPSMFGFPDGGDRMVRGAETYASDCSDVFDDEFIAQTRWKQDLVTTYSSQNLHSTVRLCGDAFSVDESDVTEAEGSGGGRLRRRSDGR